MKTIKIKPNNPQQDRFEQKCKLWGMSRNDLLFYAKNNYTPISKIDLITGVLVGFRGTSTQPRFFSPWRLLTYNHSEDELNHMHALINNTLDVPAGSSYDYFIMDVFGNILHSNCDITTTKDDNEIIHLKSKNHGLDQLIYPAAKKKFKYKYYYCCGDNIQELNNHINALAEKNIIAKPKNFKKGFNQTQETSFTGINLEK